MRVLANHQMGVQGHGLADMRQPVQRRHRHFQLIADAVDIQHQVRRLFFGNGAA
ncbi:hypothetical protein ALP29_200847 [Pseudomonas syringae pv. avii]|uniref:Uncharacterized protein n=1 Tax=Pseudomonas syringae pv. avii TaxID=663959 RepID=A0A3M5U720_PSESX|nr:hypothetical protein ALP29_200847 [Pseudomonas syringae pv. avii]